MIKSCKAKKKCNNSLKNFTLLHCFCIACSNTQLITFFKEKLWIVCMIHSHVSHPCCTQCSSSGINGAEEELLHYCISIGQKVKMLAVEIIHRWDPNPSPLFLLAGHMATLLPPIYLQCFMQLLIEGTYDRLHVYDQCWNLPRLL